MPKEGESPFVAFVIGPPGLERMVIKDNRGQRPRYFTGLQGRGWTDDPREALRYGNVDDLSADLQEIQVAELGHRGVTRYALDLDVTVIGNATPEQVRQYLFDALTIGLDYRHHGDGPTEDSLVMVKTDTTSLRSSEVPEQD
jgi:hypothetical protein